MKYNKGCMICGKELVYTQDYRDVECAICADKFKTNVTCENGHYICDACHNMSGNDFIEEYCANSDETDPIAIACSIMRDPRINLHGPEHHFLVPAALLTAYYNKTGEPKKKKAKLKVAKERASKVPGGFCGYFGSCGAAIGVGIFFSIITEATPLTKETWGLANKSTGSVLMKMGDIGGPRCCKRSTFLAIIEAARMLDEEIGAGLLDFKNIKPFCEYKGNNEQCIKLECPYFLNKRGQA